MSNKISEWLKLKDSHPTMIKLMKLYDLANELGIHIQFGHRSVILDEDRDVNLPPMFLEDLDNGDSVTEWPPTFDFKVVSENPEYKAAAKQAHNEWKAKEAEKEQLLIEAKRAKEQAEQEIKRQEIETKELKELARLKKKYEDQ